MKVKDAMAKTIGKARKGDIDHVMTLEIETIAPEDDLETAGKKMERAQVRRLPVVDQGRLVGVLSHGNLVQATGGKGGAEKATVGVTRGA